MNLRKLCSFFCAVGVFSLFTVGAAPLKGISQDSKATSTQKAAGDKKSETAAKKGNATKGKEIFEQNCQLCHDPKSDTATIGPGLKGFFKNNSHKGPDGKVHSHTEAMARKQIENGGEAMPPMGSILSKEQIDDVIAYLHTL